jgi:two-component system, chemotaxis family, sensor kinase CheA
MADPYRYFRVEAGEILEQLQKGLLELEKGAPPAEVVARLLRLAHTLKGAARVVKQKGIADLSHALEDVLVPVRDIGAPIGPGMIGGALAQVDAMQALLLALAPVAASAEPTNRKDLDVAPPEAFWATNANSRELDALMDGISELNSQLGAARRSLLAFERARSLAEMLSAQLGARHVSKAGDAGVGKLGSLAQELQSVLAIGDRELAASTEQAARELSQVRDAAERLRLVPADLMWGSLERTVRDSALSLGKQVKFTARGGDVRLDADLLGPVQRALLQAVRNSVAHGVELPSERAAASKPAEGEISIDVMRLDKHVSFTCRDDGRGLDLAAVRRSAEAKGIAPGAVAGMDTESLIRLLLQGGISTASAVTGMSGRGVGLDLVRETAEKLSGNVSLEGKPGRGTTLTITVPVSLSALSALLVEVTGQVVALPLSAVRGSARLVQDEIAHSAAGDTIVFDGKSVAYAQLAELLGIPESAHGVQKARSTVFVEAAEGWVALGVDSLLGVESIVARALPELVLLAPVVSGASFDADGNPRMVLSPDGLARAARRRVAEPRVVAQRRAPILVIDDSLTTRMLEQSILESAGYEVELATSGEEALDKAKQRSFALFLVDVEMPGIDGFTFIEQARRDPALKDIPAILVTSRASAADLQRGIEVGAQAHIEKKEFNQKDLLERIRKLVS